MEAYISILEDFLTDWSHKERCIIEQNARYTQHSFSECKFFLYWTTKYFNNYNWR